MRASAPAPRITNIVVDLAKLRDYCLSDSHPRGRHKARVFRSRLGLAADDAAWLADELLQAARTQQQNFVSAGRDAYGERFILDVAVTTSIGTATVRAGWIVRRGEQALRFVTCFVLR